MRGAESIKDHVKRRAMVIAERVELELTVNPRQLWCGESLGWGSGSGPRTQEVRVQIDPNASRGGEGMRSLRVAARGPAAHLSHPLEPLRFAPGRRPAPRSYI